MYALSCLNLTIPGAFGGLFYLSLYLCGKMHVLDSRGEVWKSFLVLIPTLGAALVAGSRIMDARHHPFDVITGSLLGIITAWIAYRQFFPALSDFKAKGRAYPIRTWGHISETYEGADAVPLRGHDSKMGFVSGRESPTTGSSGNAFRDEVNRSQRRRGGGLDGTSASDIAPAMPASASAPHYSAASTSANTGNRNQYHRDNEWDDSTDEEGGNDLELQPTYTLSGAAGSRYEPPASNLASQNTAYSGYKPPASVGDVGTAAKGSSSPPPPPPHSEALRGV